MKSNYDSMTLQRTFDTTKDALAFIAERIEKLVEGMELSGVSIRRQPVYERQSKADFDAFKPAKLEKTVFNVTISFASPFEDESDADVVAAW